MFDRISSHVSTCTSMKRMAMTAAPSMMTLLNWTRNSDT